MQRRNFFKAILGGVAALAATRLGAERSVEAAGITHPLPAAPIFISGFDMAKGDQITQGTFAFEHGEVRLVSSRILPWAETFPLASQWPPVPLPSPRTLRASDLRDAHAAMLESGALAPVGQSSFPKPSGDFVDW